MKRSSEIFSLVLTILTITAGTGFSAMNLVTAQRLERPPARDIEGTPILPSGINAIPAGTILILEMETPLNSGTSRISDRFQARVATPVIDGTGRTLVPAGALVEGHVSSVTPAKWRRRSGIIAITFDRMQIATGRLAPIRGYLTSVDASDRKRIDDEGNLKGGSLNKRDIVFVGGGAGAGAAIGAVTGGALAGAGIGAAAGLTATLLMKGKDAVVEEGQRIGLELTQDVSITAAPTSITRPSQPSTGGARPRPPITGGGQQVPTRSGLIDVSDVRAERGSDGLLRILITAETPTSGWRIYTNHELTSDAVYVRLRGVPPTGAGATMISHPTAPTITIPDSNGRFRTVVVVGKNGTRTTQVNAPPGSSGTFTPTQPVDYPNTPPSTGSGTPVPPSTPPASTGPGADFNSQASRIANQIEQIRYDYGATVGVWINRDGSYDPIGQRQPTADERKLLDSLGALLNSVRALNLNSPNSAALRTNAARVQEDTRVVEQAWRRVPASSNLNQKIRTMIQDARNLANQAAG
ncbi:MAG: hypothetical protein IPM66_21285 [Acidobacteriota bacterium]|nr:MAG: hypothetical protein IPM66_21285 [Acidobacteriota bacterium]